VYNHLPNIDPMRSSGGRHRAHESEHATMRRVHREQVAEERARIRTERAASPPRAERIFSGPAAAIMALVGLRR
jgi:hypothetical protein